MATTERVLLRELLARLPNPPSKTQIADIAQYAVNHAVIATHERVTRAHFQRIRNVALDACHVPIELGEWQDAFSATLKKGSLSPAKTNASKRKPLNEDKQIPDEHGLVKIILTSGNDELDFGFTSEVNRQIEKVLDVNMDKIDHETPEQLKQVRMHPEVLKIVAEVGLNKAKNGIWCGITEVPAVLLPCLSIGIEEHRTWMSESVHIDWRTVAKHLIGFCTDEETAEIRKAIEYYESLDE